MNRGFSFYYGEAVKSSATTIWKNKNFFKVIAFWLMELIGRLCLLGPIFDLASVRQAKLAQKYREASVPENFKVACRANSVWTMLFALVLEGLMVLAGVVIIAVAGGLFVGLGALIGRYAAPSDIEVFYIVFSVPVGIVLLTYLFIAAIMLSPTKYIVASNPGIGAAEAVSACLKTMRERGKATVFTVCFITSLIIGAIVGAMAGMFALMQSLLAHSEYAPIANLLLLIICVAAFFMTVPMFTLAGRIALNSLFEDIALDSVNAVRNTTGINIKKYRGMQYDADFGKTLTGLFDETESDGIPLPYSEGRRRKHSDAMRAEQEYQRARAAEQAAAPQEPPTGEPHQAEPAPQSEAQPNFYAPPEQRESRAQPQNGASPAREAEEEGVSSAGTQEANGASAQETSQPFGFTQSAAQEERQSDEPANGREEAPAEQSTAEQPVEQPAEQTSEQPAQSEPQGAAQSETAAEPSGESNAQEQASYDEFVFSSTDTESSPSSDGGWNGEWPADSE